MKKLLGILCIMLAIFVMPIISNAADEPVYDESYNNGAGAFYANGTEITIREDNETKNTVVYWNGGSQIITNTTTIFGGGNKDSNYDSSNITMESGNVAFIYGGGFSTSENESADVSNTSININGGTVKGAVIGGGLLYSNVQNSNIVINDGTVASVQGGGLASATINGVNYNTGNSENPQDSLTRVKNVNLTINNGTINSNSLGYGLVYGGGQGYSYTENVNLTINGGDMSKAYVTAGGSNGYTGKTNVNITGGDINIYQSVNRGKVASTELKVTGGTINSLYVGGEAGDTSVNGIIDTANVNIVGGTVENLEKGTSGGQELVIDGQKFTTIFANGTVENNNIGEQEIEISYSITINKPKVEIYEKQSEQLEVIIKTEPEGYENLFNKEEIKWSSGDENIATVDSNGVVTGKKQGDTTITATLNNQTITSEVSVLDTWSITLFIVIMLILFFFLIILLVLY